jgi:small-conductance mechanosensitive channel
MTTIIDRVFKFFHRYRKLVKMIDSKTKTKNVIKAVLSSMLISVLILLPVVLLVVNMFIYTKLTIFLAVFLVFLALIWCLLYYAFYYKILTYYHPEIESINRKIPQYVESSFLMFFMLIFGIIVLSIIF